MKTKLLASAASELDILGLIARFYCTKPDFITLYPNGPEFVIFNGPHRIENGRVIIKRGRYRFEMVSQS